MKPNLDDRRDNVDRIQRNIDIIFFLRWYPNSTTDRRTAPSLALNCIFSISS